MKKYISLFLCCAALWLYACGSPEQSAEIPAPVGDTGAARTVNVEFTTDDGATQSFETLSYEVTPISLLSVDAAAGATPISFTAPEQ